MFFSFLLVKLKKRQAIFMLDENACRRAFIGVQGEPQFPRFRADRHETLSAGAHDTTEGGI